MFIKNNFQSNSPKLFGFKLFSHLSYPEGKPTNDFIDFLLCSILYASFSQGEYGHTICFISDVLKISFFLVFVLVGHQFHMAGIKKVYQEQLLPSVFMITILIKRRV